jgi:cell wall-associated NlpC family hydrolase
VTVLTTAAAAAVAFSSQAANAAPSEKPSKDEVKAKVDKLYEEAEQATEKYNGAKEKQEKLQKEISTIQDNVARGQEELNELRDSLGLAAASQYRTGSIDPSVQLFLSANPEDYLDKASTLDQLSSQQVEALKKVEEQQRELAQERAEATEKLKDLASTRAELGKQKTDVQGKLAAARKLLNSLTAQQRAALQEQQARASRDSARTALSASGTAASSRALAAFQAGQTRIGDPYVYGATGPNSFDCSGFTGWSYAQAGVSLPRTSQEQANVGTRIYNIKDLRVGDLVFFYNLDHVALYAGNGQVLHAPHTGAVVRYEAMSDMPFDFGVRV